MLALVLVGLLGSLATDSLAVDSLAARPAVLSASATATWPSARFSVRLRVASGAEARVTEAPALPDRQASPGVAAVLAGSGAGLGSLLGALGGGLVYAASALVVQRRSGGGPAVAAGVVAAGTVVGATAAVAYLGQPMPPAFAGFPTGESDLQPTDWRSAVPGILIGTAAGVALGYAAGQIAGGGDDAVVIGFCVAVPVSQSIGAGLGVLRSRLSERRP